MNAAPKEYLKRISYHDDRCFADNTLSLLGEPIITPEQFFKNSSEEMSGEKLLLRDLLIDAVECVFLRIHPRYEILPQSLRTLADETMEWFLKGDVGQFTFYLVCDHLGVEQERIRGKLKELIEKTSVHKALFAFRYQKFSQEDTLFAVLSYKNGVANGNSYPLNFYQQFFSYVLRSITKPIMTYDQIGKNLDCRKADAAKAYKDFFLSYAEGVPGLLQIAEDFYAHFYTVMNKERMAA